MLHWAAEQGNSDIVSLLLKAGFDPAALNLVKCFLSYLF
jgi:ankyrin repeat protein